MPDHVHLLLWVQSKLPEPLGLYIARFKNLVNKDAASVPIFREGFNDQIITNKRDLHSIFEYIRSNPYRLAISHACPDFFTRRNRQLIGDTPCQLYGNLELLHNPFKEQVIVHRADTTEQFERNKEKWLYIAANGGILVSPFISKREKEIRMEAEAVGGRFILIMNAPVGEREKPCGKEFALCAEGRLLIIAPQTPLDFSRSACLQMNKLASLSAEYKRS